MTGLDIAMLALTLAGFALIALLPYAAFRVVEVAETAFWRVRDRAMRNRSRIARGVALMPRTQPRAGARGPIVRDATGRFSAARPMEQDVVRRDPTSVR